MTEGVIDGLEIVQVAKNSTMRSLFPHRMFSSLLREGKETPAGSQGPSAHRDRERPQMVLQFPVLDPYQELMDVNGFLMKSAAPAGWTLRRKIPRRTQS